jgi:hypothetical protein
MAGLRDARGEWVKKKLGVVLSSQLFAFGDG